MACLPLRLGNDVTRDYSLAPGVHSSSYIRMKQALSRVYLYHKWRGPPSHLWGVRNFCSQHAAIEEAQFIESSEICHPRWQAEENKVLIEAKIYHDLENLRAMEADVKAKTTTEIWKDIEMFCRERGVRRSFSACKSRWRRLLIAYSQIKSRELIRNPEMPSYWSMKLEERRANGFSLVSLDESTYKQLDKLYEGKGDAFNDALKEDAVYKVAEAGRVQHLHAGRGINPLLKVEEVFAATSLLSSPGPVFSQETHTMQVGGAAKPVEKAMGDETHSDQVLTSDRNELVERTQEERSGQVPNLATCSQETCQRKDINTLYASTRARIQDERQSGEFAEFSASSKEASTDVDPTQTEILAERQDEQSGSVALSLEETHQSKDTGILNEWKIPDGSQTGPVVGSTLVLKEACDGRRPSAQEIKSLNEMRSYQVDGVEVYLSASAASHEKATQSHNRNLEFSTIGVEDDHKGQSGKGASHVSSMGSKVSDKLHMEQVAGNEALMSNCVEPSKGSHQSQSESTLLSSHGRMTEEVAGTTPSQGAVCKGYVENGNFVASGLKVNGELQSKEDGDSIISENISVSVSRTDMQEGGYTAHNHIFVDSSKAVGKDFEYMNVEGSSKQGMSEGKVGMPTTDEEVDASKDSIKSIPETSKANVNGQGLQLYDARKLDDDIVMYVPGAIGNALRSVSRTLKKLFKF